MLSVFLQLGVDYKGSSFLGTAMPHICNYETDS